MLLAFNHIYVFLCISASLRETFYLFQHTTHELFYLLFSHLRRSRFHSLLLTAYPLLLYFHPTKIVQKNVSSHPKKTQFFQRMQKTAKKNALLRAIKNPLKTKQKPALFVHFSVIQAISRPSNSK